MRESWIRGACVLMALVGYVAIAAACRHSLRLEQRNKAADTVTIVLSESKPSGTP